MTETPHSEPGLFFPFMAGFHDRASGFAYPLIRFFTGLILMPHGARKLFGWFGGRGLAATGGRLRREARARARPVLCSPGRRAGVLRRFLPRHRPDRLVARPTAYRRARRGPRAWPKFFPAAPTDSAPDVRVTHMLRRH